MSAIRTNAAAAMLGVSPNTLRSWERRFGFPQPRRTPGGHRQFDLGRDRGAAPGLRGDPQRLVGDLDRPRARDRPLVAHAAAVAARRASTRSAPTGCSRRASPCARSSARSRRSCCPPSTRSARARTASRPSTASPGAGRPAGSPRRRAPRRPPTAPRASCSSTPRAPLDLDALHAQALELVLRRAGVRTLSLPVDLDPLRVGRALVALTPRAVVLAGRSASLDALGRLVYAARRVGQRRRRSTTSAARSPRRARAPSRGSATARWPAREKLLADLDTAARDRARRAPHSVSALSASARTSRTSAAAGTFRRADARARRPAGPPRAGLAPARRGQRPPAPDRRPRARGALAARASRSSSCSPPRAASSSCARCATGCGRRRPTRPRSSRRSSRARPRRRAGACRTTAARRRHADRRAAAELVDRPLPRAHRARSATAFAVARRGRRSARCAELCRKLGLASGALRLHDRGRQPGVLATRPIAVHAPRGPGRPAAVLPRRSSRRCSQRWRERDVFARVAAPPRGRAEPWVFYEGPPTANGRPGAHHVLARVFKDIYPRFKTMRGHLRRAQGRLGLPRPAGRDRRRAAARHRRTRSEIEAYGIAEFNAQVPRVGLRVPRGLERADRADRLLGRPRRRLPHARPDLHRVGLVGAAPDLRQGPALRGPQGRPVLPALRHRAVARTRSRSATRTSSTRRSTCASRSPRTAAPLQAGDELLVWTTTPWTLVSNAAVAVDPELTYVRAKTGAARARRSSSPRRSSSACSATRTCRSSTASPAPRSTACATSRRSRYIPATRVRRARPHRPARRLRHRRRRHRPRAHRDRVRRGRLPARRALRAERRQPGARSTAPTTSASAPYAGRFVKDADPDLVEDLRARGRLLRAEELRARLPALLALRRRRCSTTPSRPGTSRRRSCATGCSPPTRRSTGTPSTSSTGASATGSRTTSTGRCRASATGARRCRSGAARRATCTASARSTSSRSSRGVRLEDPHRPYVDEVALPVPAVHAARCSACPRSSTCGSTRARCRSPSSTRRSRTRSASSERFPADFICEALDQTRGWFYSLLGGLDAAVRPRAVRERRLPRPDPRRARARRCRSPRATSSCPWEVLDRFGADALRWYFFTSKQPWDGYRFSTGARSARACGCSCDSCGTPTASTSCTRTPTGRGRRRAEPTTELDRWILLAARRDGRRGHRAPRGLRRDDRRPRDRRVRRRPLQLVRAPLAAALLGRRRARRSRRCATCLVDGGAAARAVHAVRRRRDLREPRRRASRRCT